MATDLGLFHNYTGKGTCKPSAANTIIGYFQRGRKEKPKRSLSTLIPPESVLAQDSITYTYKGEWQRVFSNRTFLDVTVGNYHSIWPMVPQVTPTTHIRRSTNRSTGARRGRRLERVQLDAEQSAGQGAADLLPAGQEAAATTSSSASSSATTTTSSASTASRDRIAIRSDAGARRRPHPVRRRRRERPTSAPAGPSRRTSISSTPCYVQDRWAPNNRLTITAGVRIDHQTLSTATACASRSSATSLPDGTPHLPDLDDGRRRSPV